MHILYDISSNNPSGRDVISMHTVYTNNDNINNDNNSNNNYMELLI